MENISELMVLRSAAGYYIGRLDADGLPWSRESVEYYPTSATAQEALDTHSYTPRNRA